MNITIPVPAGTTDHGQPGLLCVPPAWTDIFTFFATSYFAHAATVLARPGQSFSETLMDVVSALFVPGFGTLRTMRYLILHPATIHGDDLRRAAAAGALCMVIRRERRVKGHRFLKQQPDTDAKMWDEEQVGHEMQQLPLINSPHVLGPSLCFGSTSLTTPSSLGNKKSISNNAVQDVHTVADGAANDYAAGVKASPTSTKTSSQASDWYSRIFDTATARIVPPRRRFYGHVVMPEGSTYELAECPPGTPFKAYGASADGAAGAAVHPAFHISSSYSAPKILIGLFQAVWAVVTLYQVRGDQLDLYGYAAFGLTVAPYAFMSIINIVANLVTPEYSTMFLVHTPDLDEAREAGGRFVGMIAAVDVDRPIDPQTKVELGYGPKRFAPALVLLLIILVAPIAIVAGLSSKFQPGSISTAADRGWVMSWLVVGSVSSVWAWLLRNGLVLAGTRSGFNLIAYFLLMAPFFVPAIGGMVTVGKMLQSYGVCTDFRS